MRGAEFAEILRSAIDAAVRPQEWDGVCDRIVASSDFPAFFIFEYDSTNSQVPIMHLSRAIREGGMDLVDDLIGGRAPQAETELYGQLVDLPPYRHSFEHEVLGFGANDALPPNAIRDAILNVTGARWRFGGRLNDFGPVIDIASGHLGGPTAELPADIRANVDVLFSVVGKSLETGRVIRRLVRSYQAMLDFFDTLDFGAAFCDAEGRIVVSNRQFGELAAERDGLTDVGGIAGATHPEDRPRMRGIIHGATRPAARPEDLIMSLRRRSQGVPFVARTLPLREAQTGVDAPLALLLVFDVERRGILTSEGLSAFGILSPEELAICDMLVQGAGAAEISRSQDTTPGAAAARIDGITAKLACRNRLDLVRLAMMTSAPVRRDPG